MADRYDDGSWATQQDALSSLSPAARASYDAGIAAGQDMSWMLQPGALTANGYISGNAQGDPQAPIDQSQPPTTTAGVNPTDAWIPQIHAWYQQYLGRDASDGEIQGHLGNPQGLSGIEAAIKGSPEATAYVASQGKKTDPGTTTTTTNTGGSLRDQVLQHINSFLAAHPNSNPSLKNDPNYWADRILQTHPDGNVDWGYWEGRFVQPEGPPEGGANTSNSNWFQQNPPPGQFNTQYNAPGGAPSPYSVPGGSPSPYAVPPRDIPAFVPQKWTDTFNAPTAQDLQNTPGFMASQDAAQKGLERSAAANGSILSGGFVGTALPRALGQLAGQQYQQLYNNAYQTYQDRYKQFQDTNNNALQAYAANVGGYNADVGNALAAFNANNGAYQSNVQNALQQYNAQQGAYQNAVGNSLNQYDRRYQSYQDLIKNNLSYAQLGLNATTAGSPGSAQ